MHFQLWLVAVCLNECDKRRGFVIRVLTEQGDSGTLLGVRRPSAPPSMGQRSKQWGAAEFAAVLGSVQVPVNLERRVKL